MEVHRVCSRCGIDRDLLPKRSGRKDYCRGCRTKVEHVIRYGKDVCLAWRGDFDQYDNPVHNGALFLPGYRTCKHRDCINTDHIDTEKDNNGNQH